MADHPVKVPQELAEQLWFESADKPAECKTFRAHVFAQLIADWAADQELEACCEIARDDWRELSVEFASHLRAARRHKPPTLAERGLAELEEITTELHDSTGSAFTASSIRAALNRLAELEANQ